MSAIDAEEFRALLLKTRDDLNALASTTDAAAQPVELDQTRVGRLSRMDAMQAQAMSVDAQRRRDLQLTRIEAALQRLNQGNFGTCIRCGEEIAKERLRIEPTALLCIDCANSSEQSQ